MKALTLTQPWASLMASGLKQIETRSWSTHYRGPLAIHAAKAFPGWAKEFWEGYGHGVDVEHVDTPLGVIVAVCELHTVVSTTHPTLVERLPYAERELGDFAPGRFAWIVKDVYKLTEPIPCRGHLGLWNVPGDVLAQIEAGTVPA